MEAHPPGCARLLVRLCTPPALRDSVVGDLEEEFASRVLPRRGARSARRWYWSQALRSVFLLVSLLARDKRAGLQVGTATIGAIVAVLWFGSVYGLVVHGLAAGWLSYDGICPWWLGGLGWFGGLLLGGWALGSSKLEHRQSSSVSSGLVVAIILITIAARDTPFLMQATWLVGSLLAMTVAPLARQITSGRDYARSW